LIATRDGVATSQSDLLPAPAPAPAATKAAAAANKPYDEKEYHRTDGRVDDSRHDTDAKVDTDLGQQPVANEGPDDPDEKVTDETKRGASHDLARQPSGNKAYQQYDEKTLV
jgi:hypothetical protein